MKKYFIVSLLILSSFLFCKNILAVDEKAEANMIFKSGTNLSAFLNNLKKVKNSKDQVYAMKKHTEPLAKGLRGLKITDKYAINNFIVYGTRSTYNLSAKKRYDLVSQYKAKYKKLPTTEADWINLLKLNAGKIVTTTKCEGTITDKDKNVYKIIKIGEQCWMAENLKVGIKVSGNVNQADANAGVIQKYCYDNSDANCNSDGALYQWHTVMAFPRVCYNHENTPPCAAKTINQGICPTGWHVPSFFEFQTLARNAIPNCDLDCSTGTCSCGPAGPKFMATSWSGGTDNFGFSALPAGFRSPTSKFVSSGVLTVFWSASPKPTRLAPEIIEMSSWNFYIGVNSLLSTNSNSRSEGYSVRCLRD